MIEIVFGLLVLVALIGLGQVVGDDESDEEECPPTKRSP